MDEPMIQRLTQLEADKINARLKLTSSMRNILNRLTSTNSGFSQGVELHCHWYFLNQLQKPEYATGNMNFDTAPYHHR